MKLNLHPKLEVGGLKKSKKEHNRMNKSLNHTKSSLVGAAETVWAPK